MNKRIALGLSALAALSVIALAGCGGGSKGGSADEVVVKLQGTKFAQSEITVKAGTTVKWVNEDPVDHSVFEGEPDSDKYSFKSEELGQKDSYTHKFDEPGTYDIFCNTASHHLLGMKMKVVVN